MRWRVMGILNVTPDSFSDGGRYVDPRAAIARAEEMIAEGADVVDVGGESTRPGAEPVSPEEEIARVVPVIEALARAHPGLGISVDTMKAEVAEAAIDAGADFVNDVSGGGDPRMLPLVASRDTGLCLMHMKGEPRTMQREPSYDDVVAEVRDYLVQRADAALAAGVDRERIVLDPGIGFGKTASHNLELLRGLGEIVATGFPVLVGASRKSFIGLTLDLPVEERLEGSLAVAAHSALQGAAMLRVHDVRATVRMLRMLDAVLGK